MAAVKYAVVGLCLWLGLAQAGTQGGSVAFTNVAVVPMDREQVLEGWTVVVRDGRIVEAAPSRNVKTPDGARVVDGTGKYLIPALAEMHAHIPPGAQVTDAAIERTLFMYAANGLGIVRGMLGHERHLAFRDRARKGEIFSPLIYTSGPSLNGNSAPTPEAATKMVAEQKAAGYDFLKIHPGLSLRTFQAMAAAAETAGMRFAGHVPADVGLARALEARYHTIDHLDGYVESLAGDGAPASQWFGINLADRVDVKRIPDLVAATKRAGTAMVATQTLLENTASDEPADALAARPEMKYATAQQLKDWSAAKTKFLEIPAEQRRALIATRRRLIKALFDGGVPFLLGSDAPQIWNVPGFSVHRELEALVTAGLTPFQALQTGTTNIAAFYGTASVSGRIAPGFRADLVLIEGNPLSDIRNTRRISGVMLGGRWMGKQEIEKRLDSGS